MQEIRGGADSQSFYIYDLNFLSSLKYSTLLEFPMSSTVDGLPIKDIEVNEFSNYLTDLCGSFNLKLNNH